MGRINFSAACWKTAGLHFLIFTHACPMRVQTSELTLLQRDHWSHSKQQLGENNRGILAFCINNGSLHLLHDAADSPFLRAAKKCARSGSQGLFIWLKRRPDIRVLCSRRASAKVGFSLRAQTRRRAIDGGSEWTGS